MNLAAGAVPGVPLFCIVNGEIFYSVDGGTTWVAQSRISGPVTFSGEVIMQGIADFASTGVSLSVPLTTPPSSASVQSSAGEVHTLDIDCTAATGADKGTIVPARAGSIFVISRWCATVVQKTGGTVTTNPLFNVGSVSPAFADWLNGTTSPLTVGAINEGLGASGCSNVVATVAAPTVGAAIHAGLAQAQVGATVLVIRIALTGYWTTIP